MAKLTDKQLEIEIGAMLQAGVTLSAAVVLAGGVLYLRHASGSPVDYVHFHATADHLRTIRGVIAGARRMDAQSIVQLGILLLIATPVVRVGLCVVGFARQRDGLYVAISMAVLLILLYSLVFR